LCGGRRNEEEDEVEVGEDEEDVGDGSEVNWRSN